MTLGSGTAPEAAAATPANPREWFRTWTAGVAAAAPVALAAIVVVLLLQALPSLQRFGPGFLTGRTWDPVAGIFGALPYIYGTVVTSVLAMAVAVPVGVAVGVFLAQPNNRGLRGILGTGVELLAAIPSVVYGLWALYIMAPWVFVHVETPVSKSLGFIPLLSGPALPTSTFSAALVLAIMVLPTLAAVSRDVVRAVPGGLREAAVALGATWWETTWRVVLPAARLGIFGAGVLALGRALGETIAVTLVIGNRPEIPRSLFSPAYTLASVIANEFTEATDRLYTASLVELGLVLILITLTVNVGAQLLVRAGGSGAR